MNKNKVLNVRMSETTYKKIDSIRKQMIKKGFSEEELTDSFIIRESIRTFDEKLKYLIYKKE